jgi:hypothetical protein
MVFHNFHDSGYKNVFEILYIEGLYHQKFTHLIWSACHTYRGFPIYIGKRHFHQPLSRHTSWSCAVFLCHAINLAAWYSNSNYLQTLCSSIWARINLSWEIPPSWAPWRCILAIVYWCRVLVSAWFLDFMSVSASCLILRLTLGQDSFRQSWQASWRRRLVHSRWGKSLDRSVCFLRLEYFSNTIRTYLKNLLNQILRCQGRRLTATEANW